MNRNEQHIINSLQKKKTELPSDDYFAALKSGVLAKINQEAKVIPLYKRWWFVSSAAASIVFIIALSVFIKQDNTSAKDPDWSSVSKDEMYAYVENNISEFETEDVADQLADIPEWQATVSFTGNQSAHTAEVKTLFDELDKEEILEYLQEDVVEIDDESITGF